MTHPLFVALLVTLSLISRGASAESAPLAAATTHMLAAVSVSQRAGGPESTLVRAAAATGAPAVASQAATVEPVPAELPAVVARVNGDPIERAELERAVRSIEQRAGGPVPPDRRDEIYRGLLDQMVTFRVLLQESAQRKVTVTDADVEERMNMIRQQFPDEASFVRALAEQELTVDGLRNDARTDMVISKMIEAEVEPKVSVQAEDVTGFYDQNREQFQEGESVRASHILIRVDEQADAAARAAARKEIEAILEKVRAGADFAALAREHSQDPGSAPDGGDLDFFGQGMMVPSFEAAAFALTPGQVSDVVESPFGFHIIRVSERRPARLVPLDEVRDDIEAYLGDQQRQQHTMAFIEQLRAKSKIEVFI